MELNFDDILKRVAKKIEARIRLQMPVKSGDLLSSLQVFVNNNEIYITYNDYGKFTNLGTGKYEIKESEEFEGYRKGDDGIRAQEWSAVPESTIDEILANVEKEIDKEIDKEFESGKVEVVEITL